MYGFNPFRILVQRTGGSIALGNQYLRTFSSCLYLKKALVDSKQKFNYDIEFDTDYICNPDNTEAIKRNIELRNSNADIAKVISLWKLLQKQSQTTEELENIKSELKTELLKIPNRTCPNSLLLGNDSKIIKSQNNIPNFNFKPKDFQLLAQNLNLFTMNHHLSLMAGPKAYLFHGDLADFERALVRYTVQKLLKKGFKMVSVPDLLWSDVIERCGMQTTGARSQVYRLNDSWDGRDDLCMSGTSEMALGGLLMDRCLKRDELPLKLLATSRCFREEVGRESADKGMFRVHEFTKVEMFVVTESETGAESEEAYKEIVDIQVELFTPLGIHFKVLDMPPCELGAPAYAKTDIEAWIPGRERFGEISSASNCLDFQSRRLNISYLDGSGKRRFAHTLNGTACAVPRMMMAVATSNQNKDGTIQVPEVLRPFLDGKEKIEAHRNSPSIKHFHSRTYSGKIVSDDNEPSRLN